MNGDGQKGNEQGTGSERLSMERRIIGDYLEAAQDVTHWAISTIKKRAEKEKKGTAEKDPKIRELDNNGLKAASLLELVKHVMGASDRLRNEDDTKYRTPQPPKDLIEVKLNALDEVTNYPTNSYWFKVGEGGQEGFLLVSKFDLTPALYGHISSILGLHATSSDSKNLPPDAKAVVIIEADSIDNTLEASIAFLDTPKRPDRKPKIWKMQISNLNDKEKLEVNFKTEGIAKSENRRKTPISQTSKMLRQIFRLVESAEKGELIDWAGDLELEAIYTLLTGVLSGFEQSVVPDTSEGVNDIKKATPNYYLPRKNPNTLEIYAKRGLTPEEVFDPQNPFMQACRNFAETIAIPRVDDGKDIGIKTLREGRLKSYKLSLHVDEGTKGAVEIDLKMVFENGLGMITSAAIYTHTGILLSRSSFLYSNEDKDYRGY